MEALNENQCTGLAIDHLGLVADKIDDLEIISLIDERLPVSSGCGAKTSMGERVAAMILNGLGFVNSRLYVFPEFLSKRPLDRLFGKPMNAEWFNDDALGRCLDAISAYGTTKLFTEISFTIGMRKKLLGRSIHFDSSTLQLYGQYSNDPENEGIPIPARGYSKSHRHDLKQMVINLATTGKASFPIWMESHSGNASDKKIIPEAINRMNELCAKLSEVGKMIYVGDSAIYSNILPYSEDMKWLTRVPDNILPAKKLLRLEDGKLNWQPLDDGYAYHVIESNYGGVKQRWVMIHSKEGYERETKTLERNIEKELADLKKSWWHLSNELFTCAKDAKTAANKLSKTMKYHHVEYDIIEKSKHRKTGRPNKDTKAEVIGYQVTFKLSADVEKISDAKRKKGRFILSTNELDKNNLPDAEVLNEYKAQSGTERGFKFIKDNTFEVDSIFLKTPERIDALMMIMTLCLMVYGVSQYELRQSLQTTGDTIPDQRRKPTNNASMKWVYFLFLGVHELSVDLGNKTQKLVINVNGTLKQIVRYFGPRAQAIYFNLAIEKNE